jgi:alkylhydroperoxidase family enzyme
MARLAGVPAATASWFVRTVYRLVRRQVGRVPEPVAVAAHQPTILRAYAAYEWFLARADRVDKRLKALAALKAAARVGCPF